MRKLLGFLLVVLILSCATTNNKVETVNEPKGRIEHNGQELFLSGMNLAWINFGRDLTNFNEVEFVRALDELSSAGANSVRWWIHVNGSTTPEWDGSMVKGMPKGSIDNLKRALDLAWERKIVVVLCLWSFDMLENQSDPIRNKAFLEDSAAVESYLDNALTPMVKGVGDHPAVVAWEVFNEPEGMVEGIGWAANRVSMKTVQYFVNRVAGRIHSINSRAKVTNGTKDMSTQTDVGQFTNYYTDERLIEIGGDPLGTLDFYQVHYYPSHMGEEYSPFHKPKSYWQLDKPLLIGEFPAVGIVDYGSGFRPNTTLSPEEAYVWAEKMGYAGAMAWTWTAHEAKFGSLSNIQPGLMNLAFSKRDAIVVDNKNVDWIPVRKGQVERLLTSLNSEAITNYADLKDFFKDKEDGSNLEFSILENTNPGVVNAVLDGSILNLSFIKDASGQVTLTFLARDSAGNTTSSNMEILVVDPDKGNIALFKTIIASSIENEGNAAEFANDGSLKTRFSSLYENNQSLTANLDGLFSINKVLINWEAAFGLAYDFQVSLDGENWNTVFTETNGREGLIEYNFNNTNARWARLLLNKRGTEWGFSIWELEIIGERVK